MDKAKIQLNGWKSQLLDIGKRNQLINFKETKLSTLKLISPGLDQLNNLLGKKANRIENIFEGAIQVDEFSDEEEESYAVVDGIALPIRDVYKETELKQIIKKREKENKRSKIYTNCGIYHERKVLRNLKNKAKLFQTENAVDILYVSVGLLEWYEDTKSKDIIRSPLVLIPAKIEQTSFDGPFHLNLEDVDFILNDALIKKMQIEHQLDFQHAFSAFDDINEILNYFKMLKAQFQDTRWTIHPDLFLGLFSFSKINMVKDIEENESTILDNSIIQALSGITSESISAPIDTENLKLRDKQDVYQVFDADNSQEIAIKAALNGRSFVLQGPPGTGKSQTITNIIGEMLAQNKKILFVAEKKAALDVVYSNLEKVELAKYALPLHNNKVNKKAFIQELYADLINRQETIEISQDDSQRLFDELNHAEEKLTQYASELLEINVEAGVNLYQILGEYSIYMDAPFVDFNYPFEIISPTDLNALVATVIQYENSIAKFPSGVSDDFWVSIRLTSLSLTDKKRLEYILNKALKYFIDYQKTTQNIELISLAEAPLNTLHKYGESLANLLLNIPKEIPKTINRLSIETDLQKVEKLIKSKQTIADHETFVSSKLSAMALEEINRPLIDSVFYHTPWWKTFFSKGFKTLKNIFMSGAKAKITNQITNQLIQSFKDYYYALEDIEEIYVNPENDFLVLYDLPMLQELELAYQWRKDFQTITTKMNLNRTEFNESFLSELHNLQPTWKKLVSLNSSLSETKDALSDFYQILPVIHLKSLGEMTLGSLIEFLEKTKQHYPNLDRMLQLNQARQNLIQNDLEDFLNQVKPYETKSSLSSIFLKRYYLHTIDEVVEENPEFPQFDADYFNQLVHTFATLDRQQIDIAKHRIQQILDQNTPALEGMESLNAEVQILKREAAKSRRNMPIRLLFEKIPSLILKLKPLIMMSPLSVSTYLKSHAFDFDVVIFDEASQIQPESAIGAIYRSHQVIIVGDKEQLPPTSFFHQVDDHDMMDEDFESFKSILEISDTVLPSISLRWHYRSQFEELIEVSNNEIYKNLITFPASRLADESEGLTHKYIPNSIYQRGKTESKRPQSTNHHEAEAIVEAIYHHFEQFGADRSLGVVTFNSQQQNYVERLLYQKRTAHPQFEAYFESDEDEPFFIKNIETVQGDERDTIILSTVYGKDESGKLSMNFGPINQEHGYRRLNVAITRAKINLILVTSLKSQEIDLTRAKGKGPAFLKAYLQFAESSTKTSPVSHENGTDKIIQSISDRLRQNGYQLSQSIGQSQNTVDLAIHHPDNPGHYVLGLEIDGQVYQKSKDQRIRERLIRDVLNLRSWNLHRIWAMQWFKNPEGELAIIEQKFHESLAGMTSHLQEDAPIDVSIKKTSRPQSSPIFKEYPNLDELIENALNQNESQPLKYILDALTPVHINTLKSIIPTLYGRQVFNATVEKMFYEDLKEGDYQDAFRFSSPWLFASLEVFQFRKTGSYSTRRTFDEIHLDELQAAYVEILKKTEKMEISQLKSLILELTGYVQMSEKMNQHFNSSLIRLESHPNVQFEDKYVYFKIQ